MKDDNKNQAVRFLKWWIGFAIASFSLLWLRWDLPAHVLVLIACFCAFVFALLAGQFREGRNSAKSLAHPIRVAGLCALISLSVGWLGRVVARQEGFADLGGLVGGLMGTIGVFGVVYGLGLLWGGLVKQIANRWTRAGDESGARGRQNL